MVTLLADIHFLTLRDDVIVKDADIGAYRYQEKGTVNKERVYYNQKRKYIESRGGTIVLKNNRPVRLRDSLKELEDILTKEKLVSEGWRGGNTYQLFFSSGLIVFLTVNSAGDLVSIVFDKFVVGKLLSENVIDVASSFSYLIYSYNDARVTLLHATKPIPTTGSKTPFRFSSQEPKITTCEGIGPPGRRFERKLSINLTEKMVLVWWETGEDEVYPWSPVNKDRDRANLLVYSLSGVSVTLLCYCRTELSPLSVAFSQIDENVILTVEQGFDKVGGVTVLSCVYEVERGSLHRVTVTSIPLDAPLTAHAHNPSENCLLLACNNGVLALHCESRGMTHVTKAGLIPSCITWLHSGTLLAVVNDRGQMQCFDMALSLIRMQLLLEDSSPQRILDFSDFFCHQASLRRLKWAPQRPLKSPLENNPTGDEVLGSSIPLLLLHFSNGPLACLRVGCCGHSAIRASPKGSLSGVTGIEKDTDPPPTVPPEVLVRLYVKHRQWDEAINLLVSLSWETEGNMALQCLFAVVGSLLKFPLNAQREAQIEAALSSFLLSPVRFSPAVEEEYGPPVRALTRRFFFKLLRNGCLEKSYRLAIDLKDHDCFLNVHHVARCHGNKELASLALHSARELNSDSCWSGSCGSFVSSDSAGGSHSGSRSESASSCSTCVSDSEDHDDEHHQDVFEEGPKKKNLHHKSKSSKIPTPVPPVVSEAPPPTAVAVQSSQDGTITINIRQGSQPLNQQPLAPPLNQPVAQPVRNSVDSLKGSQHPLPAPSTTRSFPQLSSRLSGKKECFLPGSKPGVPGRLKTVKEVCEPSVSSDSNEELADEGNFSVPQERKHLRRQYEHTVFQAEVTTEEEDGGTVKVVHFGVV